MKKLVHIGIKTALWLGSLFYTGHAKAFDTDAFLDSIAMVETGADHRKIGANGERSAYQMTGAVWRQHTKLPFHVATRSPATARTVARWHVNWICQQLNRWGFPETPENVAIVWNGGMYSLRHKNRAVQDYSERVCNLYLETVLNRAPLMVRIAYQKV